MSVLADRYERGELTGIEIETLVKTVAGTSLSQFSTESFSCVKPIFTSKLIYCVNI
jgi:hypothetical protein